VIVLLKNVKLYMKISPLMKICWKFIVLIFQKLVLVVLPENKLFQVLQD